MKKKNSRSKKNSELTWTTNKKKEKLRELKIN